MNPRGLCELASRLMRHPAAPYYEHAVSAEVKEICAENGLRCEQDQFGNLLIQLRTARNLRPVVLAAHMDHPGFEVLPPEPDRRMLVRFQGGVPDHYFRPGLALRLMPGGRRAKLGRRIGKERVFEVLPARISGTGASFAVWDLPDFKLRHGKIHGRACDDLVGVAATLATMIELKKTRARVSVMGAISRAEEVGFHGALALGRSRLLPRNSLVISLETSRELPGAKMGQGVILRVGDRTSIFDSEAMRFLDGVATEQKRTRKGFQFQRALMSGGTCEATAYQEYGYQTGAVCVALGNYHNCSEPNRIAAEFVNISDACSMVDLLVEAARRMPCYDELVAGLPRRLEKLRREGAAKLRRTAER